MTHAISLEGEEFDPYLPGYFLNQECVWVHMKSANSCDGWKECGMLPWPIAASEVHAKESR